MMPVMLKPEIYISINRDINPSAITSILHGMEEEGIPYTIESMVITDIVEAAYTASTMSPLSVGLAVAHDEVIIHYKNLPKERPLFTVKRFHALSVEEQRKLGCNAARLVKGIPFK